MTTAFTLELTVNMDLEKRTRVLIIQDFCGTPPGWMPIKSVVQLAVALSSQNWHGMENTHKVLVRPKSGVGNGQKFTTDS